MRRRRRRRHAVGSLLLHQVQMVLPYTNRCGSCIKVLLGVQACAEPIERNK